MGCRGEDKRVNGVLPVAAFLITAGGGGVWGVGCGGWGGGGGGGGGWLGWGARGPIYKLWRGETMMIFFSDRNRF